LEADLLHVALDERRRIAQDLHDSLCQEISSVHFGLAGLASRLASSQAEEAAQARKLTIMLEQTLDHARQIAHGLSPIMEEGDDVVRALIRLARNTEELCGLKCHVQAGADFRSMDRDVGTQIYYITQEALNNILRHAKAGRIDILISSDEDEVVLKVSDDGCGFQSANHSAGRGLRFMRYRAAAVNGTLRLRNRPTGGTELECRIPAAAAEPGKNNSN
jgi:signal transduction histidine kinase